MPDLGGVVTYIVTLARNGVREEVIRRLEEISERMNGSQGVDCMNGPCMLHGCFDCPGCCRELFFDETYEPSEDLEVRNTEVEDNA
jgi:hypothetical protein